MTGLCFRISKKVNTDEILRHKTVRADRSGRDGREGSGRSGAVSYTHLDVYKRQTVFNLL